MSDEHGHLIKGEADPRRVYGVGATPTDVAELFACEIDRLAKGEGYGTERRGTRGEIARCPDLLGPASGGTQGYDWPVCVIDVARHRSRVG